MISKVAKNIQVDSTDQNQFLNKVTITKNVNVDISEITQNVNQFARDDGDQFKRDVTLKTPGKTTSLPSQEVAVVDIPEPGDFNVSFSYNFFVPDESINEVSKYKTFNDKIEWPRQTNVSWSPCFVRDELSNEEFSQLKSQLFSGQTSIILENQKKIISEENFTSFRFVGVKYRDEDILKKIDIHAVFSTNLLKPGMKKLDFSSIDMNDPADNFKTSISKIILNSETIKNLEFKKIQQPLTTNIKDFQFDIQFNSKFVEECMSMSVYDTFTTYDNDLISSVSSLSELTDAFRLAHDSNSLNDDDFNTYIDYFSIEKVSSQKFVTGARCIGYIVEKYKNDATESNLVKRFIVDDPNSTSLIDKEVLYGSKYAYTISSIFLVRFLAIADDTEKTQYIVNTLVSSKKLTKTVECNETNPPSYPADFDIIWDYKLKCPSLSWSFPVERQRDVKYFQVFRRLSTNQPFELIKQFSFNDSDSQVSLNEFPNENVIEDVIGSPVTFFVDEDFSDLGLKYAIYTVVCLDARGQTSPYAEQFGVSFDQTKNKLKKEIVVIAGSPKAYPNWFLNEDTFVDLVLDSGHKKIKFYVTPECTSLIKMKSKQDVFSVDLSNGQNLGFEKSGEYVLSLINLDLQQSKNHVFKLVPR